MVYFISVSAWLCSQNLQGLGRADVGGAIARVDTAVSGGNFEQNFSITPVVSSTSQKRHEYFHNRNSATALVSLAHQPIHKEKAWTQSFWKQR